MLFKLQSEYQPQGDQPQAIDALVRSIEDGNRFPDSTRGNWFR